MHHGHWCIGTGTLYAHIFSTALGTAFWLVLGVVGLVTAARESDKIVHLPGLDAPVTPPQYSGYLEVDSEQGDVAFHYWFSQAEPDAATFYGGDEEKVPVVMWCVSLTLYLSIVP